MHAPPAPSLPPLFRTFPTEGDVAAEASARAAAGAEPGTLVWLSSPDWFRAAVVLAPEHSLDVARALATQLATLALFDTLAALGPPSLPVMIAPPAVIEVNEARVGEVTIIAPDDPGDPPGWLVATVDLVVADRRGVEPGLDPWRTSLCEEGFEGVTPRDLLEAFCRNLLARANALSDAGADPALFAREWHARSTLGQAYALSAARRARLTTADVTTGTIG